MPQETPPKPRKWVTRQTEMRLRGDRRKQGRGEESDRRTAAPRGGERGPTKATASPSAPSGPRRTSGPRTPPAGRRPRP